MSFSVYFDFETTTADFVFSDQKIFVVSYCQIYSFHPGLNLDNFVIFRNFQQSPEEIYDLNHFRQKQIPYFDKIIFCQLKGAATTVLALEKSSSLAEPFSVELKFTIDTLNWFANITKSKFLELNDIKKGYLSKKIPFSLLELHVAFVGFCSTMKPRGTILDGFILL